MDFRVPVLKSEEDAKKKATETLAKIFDNQMLTVDNIKNIIAEFQRWESKSNVAVFSKIEKNISELDSSLKAIDQMMLNMTETSHKHITFYTSWKKITSQLNDYGENMEKLMISKKNVSLLTHNLNIYVKVQDQINEMKNLMQEDSNVTVVFKQIRYLAYLRVALLERVKSQQRSEKLNNLADHLMCVQEFEEEFFDKFWGYFSDVTTLATTKPEFLVKLLRLIEEDPEYINNIRRLFKTYNKPDDKFSGLDSMQRPTVSASNANDIPRETVVLFDDESSALSEVLKGKIPQIIEENFSKRFSDKTTREEILDETLVALNELYTIMLKVVPCFPPKYDIFEVYKSNYLLHIKEKIKPFLNQEELEKTPGLLIPIAHWLDQFDDILRKIGIDINQTDLVADVTYYMHLFFDHVNEVLDSNLNSVIAKNRDDKNQLKEMKKIDLEKIQSYYATDIYSSILNVIDLLSGDFKGQLLFQIVKTVFEKLMLLIKNSEDEIKELKLPTELIIACVYVADASKCVEIFPSFKKKVKSLLPRDLYDHIKVRYIKSNPSVLTMYNTNIKLGCNKVIELMFRDIEKTYLNKIFTSEWTDDILLNIFSTFGEYFNQGFVKILKTQNNLLVIVRCFIDNSVNYYIEEIIHSIRSLNRKILKGQNSPLVNYRFQFRVMSAEEIVYKEKKRKDTKDNKDKPEQQEVLQEDLVTAVGVKDLDKLENDGKGKVFKKYKFPVKKFKKEDKIYDVRKVLARIERDKELFGEFLSGFSDEATEPFSKNFTQTLGSNYINSYMGKFTSMIAIMKCHSSALKDQIIQFKEFYTGEIGKALLEALLYVREDTAAVTKSDMKLFLLDCFNCK